MAVVALHAAALTALMLAKTEFRRIRPEPIIVDSIPETPDPPPLPQPEPDRKTPKPKSVIRYVPPEVPAPRQDNLVLGEKTEVPFEFDRGPIGADTKPADPPPLPPPPLADPVRVEARLDARSRLQPPYPPSEQRAEREGVVTVRVLIGADGRVKEVEMLSATSDAFYKATEQQALRHWRFKPATVDGRPVEARKTMTVRFRLSE